MKRILIQAGHVAPREPGFESGTGAPGEQALARAIQVGLSKMLAEDGRFLVTRSAGDVPNGWKGDMFIALHADGSSNPKASGFSFGYPLGCSECELLADTVAARYMRIPGVPKRRGDNYTRALSGYYGWSRTNAPAKLLIEHGFLTNPGEREWITGSVPLIVRSHYMAILDFYGMKPPEPPAVNRKRLAALRRWIRARRTEGWGWKRLKTTHNWREFHRRGGR